MKYISILLTLLLFSCNLCDQFFNEKIESDRIKSDEVYRDKDLANGTFRGLAASMHDHLYASPYCLASFTGLYGDELINPSNPDENQIYRNNIDSKSNLYNEKFWIAAYNFILAANITIEACPNSHNLSDALKKQLIGEMFFIRAYWFFYLVNFYGNIPLPLTPDVDKNKYLGRSPITEVYNQIVSDLDTAQSLLDEHYVGGDGVTYTNERLRPNKATATAMLSRVYLYMRRYSEADSMATMLINNNRDYSMEPIKKVFLRASRETIWQLEAGTPNSSNINTSEGNKFILSNSPFSNSRISISNSLLLQFEEGDERRKEWVGTFSDQYVVPARNYYFPYKYKIINGDKQEECSIVFRLAEQYLIRAEARAYTGNLSGAVADVNMIRVRAGLPPIKADSYSLKMLLTTIMKERQIELFAEQGLRWFDLKRTGLLDAVMTAANLLKERTWIPTMKYWPIPESELIKNPNLVQNEGYN
ncbi:Starch-binding associating with outer membrane [Chitinophaga sp. YR573]|uniref:RagB/SusD family nutrient uptake outer membrane protein n=1 Tax=Chitinophaga sp. YR573 TaxID=1881040 RepID=UPI0008D3B3DC|nr:RagB/SusD family nutrient uptake outer membrane protein [Chitinophaga sp. YR573]SEW38887.1 Starch-binding associating with outer membrane [Chitinophaga sp. YR573]